MDRSLINGHIAVMTTIRSHLTLQICFRVYGSGLVRFGLSFAAIFLVAILALPQPAAATFPCPGGPGPGEVQVGVAGGSNGVAPVPICDTAGGGSGGTSAPSLYYIYGSIAWHPDADDVWMVGNHNTPYIAEREALAACIRDMGGGCTSIGEWHNSSMAILRNGTGILWNAWAGDGGAARKKALSECSSTQPIPCEVVATFSSKQRRHEPNLATARKLYAAAVWVDGTEGFDNRLYIASGHRDAKVAERLALDACAKATGRACVPIALVGNGFVQSYRRGDGDVAAVVETSARRAAQAAGIDCKKRRQICTLQTAYDSRSSGVFIHDFTAGKVSAPKR